MIKQVFAFLWGAAVASAIWVLSTCRPSDTKPITLLIILSGLVLAATVLGLTAYFYDNWDEYD